MANINKIRLSGTTYDIEDANAQPLLSAGTGIQITSDNVISVTGGGGSVTIDPTLDSGSTNPVANSAITEAVIIDAYDPYGCEINPYIDTYKMYWYIINYQNIRYVYNKSNSDYGSVIIFRLEDNVSEHTYYDYWKANLEYDSETNSNIITAVTCLSTSHTAVTATFDDNHIYFESTGSTFGNLSLLFIGYGWSDPSTIEEYNESDFNWNINDEDIWIDTKLHEHIIPSESLKDRVDRLTDILDGIKDYKAEVKEIQFSQGNAVGVMESWNPIIGKHCSTQNKTLFKYNTKDFSSDSNGLNISKSYIDKDLLLNYTPSIAIDDFTFDTQYGGSGYYWMTETILILKTNEEYTQQWGNLSLRLGGDGVSFGYLRFNYNNGRIDVDIMADINGTDYNNRAQVDNVTLGDVVLLDLRSVLPQINNLTVTVENWDEEVFLSEIDIYSEHINTATVTLDDFITNTNDKFKTLDDKEETVTKALYELKNDKLDASAYTPTDLSSYYTKTEVDNAITAATASKQDTLVSGTNIKTINNQSILGSGNITIEGGGSSVNVVQTTGTSTADVMSQDAVTTVINTVTAAIPSTYISSVSTDSDQGWIRFIRFSTPSNINYFILDNPKINGTPIHVFNGIPSNIRNFSLVETSAITTSVSSSSTDAQIPSAKSVNDKLGGLSLVKLTQSEYDALTTKDSSTLYVIVN